MKKNIFISILLVGIIITSTQCLHPEFQRGKKLDKREYSRQFKDGKFQNSIPTSIIADGKFWEMIKKYMKGGQEHREPSKPLPIVLLSKADFSNPPSEELRLAWLGHSSVLIEFEGKRYLIDPMFSQRASFVQWLGPKRFHPAPLNAENVPDLDAVIISHDHYDHLDKYTINELSNRTQKFYVPLGIGAILESWGIDMNKIVELDWWDEVKDGKIKLVSTPARHFSGRGPFNRNETLWCSWVIVGEKYLIYFSGDTGMFPEFSKIGELYGPFDVTFMKIGAYDETWPDIHITPEEAVQAHIQLKGKRLIPIHWGTFNLALHSWYEPVERLVTAAENSNLGFSIPKPGEIMGLTNLEKDAYWWRPMK